METCKSRIILEQHVSAYKTVILTGSANASGIAKNSVRGNARDSASYNARGSAR